MKKGYSSSCAICKDTSIRSKNGSVAYRISYRYKTPEDKEYHYTRQNFFVTGYVKDHETVSFDITLKDNDIYISQKYIEFTHFTDRIDIQIMKYLVKQFMDQKFGCISE